MAMLEPRPDLFAELDALEAALPGARAEFIGGQFVVNRPTRAHQFAVGEIHAHLRGVVAADEWVMDDGRVSAPALEIVPDIAVVAREWIHRPEASVPIAEVLLVVEVLSPSTEDTDRTTKRRACQVAGVDLWLVDQETMEIEAFDYGGGRFPLP